MEQLKEYGIRGADSGIIARRKSQTLSQEQTGLDIIDTPDAKDVESLREIQALERTDRFIKSTSETTELAQRMNEENTDAVKAYRWAMQEELSKESAARLGRIISEGDFLAKLRNISVCRYNDWTARGMRGLSILKEGRWQYVCAVQAGYMPEYSVLRFDEHRLPVNEKFRGWRTVLLRLILGGFISENDAHRVFGPPPINAASRRYRHQLWEFRNRKA